jgi:hypothetical protein
MRKYILSHWHGKQSLMRSCLFNGVILSVVMTVGMCIVLFGLYWLFIGFDLREPTSRDNDIVAYALMPLAIFIPVLWGIWVGVGIVRCGVRNVFDQTAGTARKIGGVLAVAWGGAIAVSMMGGLVPAVHHLIAICRKS